MSTKVLMESKDAYWYEFPRERFYVLRRWDSGDFKEYAHLYPCANGLLPDGFNSYAEALSYVEQWFGGKDFMIVNGFEASRYEVPKRW